jgi:hypothetical protein
LLGFGLTFGRLVYEHVAAGDGVGKRGEMTRLWEPDDPLAKKIALSGIRYLQHFGIDWLFLRGDLYHVQETPAMGQLHWYMGPLLLTGLIVCLVHFRSSTAARVAIVLLLAYPAGDCVARHVDGSLHALRSGPGIAGLNLLAAAGLAAMLGVSSGGTRPIERPASFILRPLRWALCAITGAAALLGQVAFARGYFEWYPTRRDVMVAYHVDYLAAIERNRPLIESADAIFCTVSDTTFQPTYVVMLAMNIGPREWREGPLEIRHGSNWDHVYRIGKWRFLYETEYTQSQLAELQQNDRPDRVLFFLRPHDVGDESPLRTVKPVDIIRTADDDVLMLVYAYEM